MKKIRINIKRLILTILYTLIASVIFWAASFINRDTREMRYVHQAVIIVAVIFTVIAFRSLLKLFPKSLRSAVYNRIGRSFNRIGLKVKQLIKAIKKKLGIPEYRKVRGKDEKKFIFDFENNEVLRKIRSISNQLRWTDLEDNSEKIRFIYIKYVNKLIRKGLKFSRYMTPTELSHAQKIKDEGKALFELYNGARYSGGRREITDDEVDQSMSLVKKM